VKVPMFAMMNLLTVEQGSRPSRPCCDPAGGGRAGCTACGRNAVEHLEDQIICPARNARSAGEIIWAGRLQPQKPEAQPRPRQDSQRDKDALGRTTPGRSHGPLGIPRCTASPASLPDTGKGHAQRLVSTPPTPAASGMKRGVEAHRKASRRVREPPLVTTRQRTASVKDGTHSCNLP
jgi:hypothetical protein